MPSIFKKLLFDCKSHLHACCVDSYSKLSLPVNLPCSVISCHMFGSMVIVYYVEGDGGHLLNERMGQPGFRTAVRGSCQSYSMPWEEIMEDLMFCVVQLM